MQHWIAPGAGSCQIGTRSARARSLGRLAGTTTRPPVRRRPSLGDDSRDDPRDDSRDVLLRALLHLLFARTPRVRRLSPPTARVARALQLPPPPDRLRRLRGTVWIASTPDIPAA